MTKEEWNEKGTELFGPDMMDWKFVCPACGHIASTQDYKDAGANPGHVAFSCVGRFLPNPRDAFASGKKKEGPCNYAGGGLLRLNPLDVDGMKVFDFATSDI